MESLVKFWGYAQGLKLEERRGWRKLGLARVESVADHSFALALLGLFEAESKMYDVGTVLKLALIHDLEESITGDLTPKDKRIRGDARVRLAKRKAVDRLLMSLPAKSRSSYRRLWMDLRGLRTKEARLVHELDKLEMALQASEYAKKVGGSRVRDFYRSAAEAVKEPSLRRVLGSLSKEP